MKQFLVLFLFLFLINTLGFTQVINQSFQDSTIYYYDLSRQPKKSINEMLYSIDRSIQFGSKSGQIELYLKSFSRKSSIYSLSKDYDNAILIALLLKDEAVKLNSKKYQGVAYRKLGFYAKKKGHLIDALKKYQTSYENFLIIDDSTNMGNVLKNIASIQINLGIYSDAENSAIKSLKYIKGRKSPDLTWVYNSLGRISKEKEDFDKAIEWYEKALNVESSLLSQSAIQQNIAVVFIKQKRYSEALSYLKQLVEIPEIIIDKKTYAKVKSNLASVKIKLNMPEAVSELLEAHELRKKLIDKKELFSSAILLSNYYSITKPKKALEYAKEANSVARIIKSPDAELESLSHLIPLSENAESKKFGIRYTFLNDSLSRVKNKIRQQYASYVYSVEESEKGRLDALRQGRESSLKAETAEFKNYIYISVIIIVLLILFFLTYYFQQRRKKEQLQERYNTEIRLSKKIHDEVGNDIFYLMTQIEKDPAFLEKNGLKLLDGLQNIYVKARDISREYTSIDTGEGFPEELLGLLNSFGNKEVKIVAKPLTPAFWNTVDKNVKSEIFRIVQELLTNMKKHSQARLAMISFIEGSQKLIIKYSDDGIGVSGEKPTLKSVENRISVLKGVLTLDERSVEGFKLSLEIPI